MRDLHVDVYYFIRGSQHYSNRTLHDIQKNLFESIMFQSEHENHKKYVRIRNITRKLRYYEDTSEPQTQFRKKNDGLVELTKNLKC